MINPRDGSDIEGGLIDRDAALRRDKNKLRA